MEQTTFWNTKSKIQQTLLNLVVAAQQTEFTCQQMAEIQGALALMPKFKSNLVPTSREFENAAEEVEAAAEQLTIAGHLLSPQSRQAGMIANGIVNALCEEAEEARRESVYIEETNNELNTMMDMDALKAVRRIGR